MLRVGQNCLSTTTLTMMTVFTNTPILNHAVYLHCSTSCFGLPYRILIGTVGSEAISFVRYIMLYLHMDLFS